MKVSIPAMKLPAFCMVGAQKSGTTTLHNYLGHHSDALSPVCPEAGNEIEEVQFLQAGLAIQFAKNEARI